MYGEMNCLQGSGNTIYSAQQLIDCSNAFGNQGCSGGSPTQALEYLQANNLSTAAAYPYTASDGSCQGTGSGPLVTSYSPVSSVASMQSWLKNNGPLVAQITLDQASFGSYSGGIFSTSGADSVTLRIIGWNQTSNPPYWICSGSYGTGFGINGLVYLPLGSDFGGIEDNAVGLSF